MINRGATLISRLAILFAVLFTLAACGGGGGGGGASFYDGNKNDPSLSFSLLDPQGNATSSVTAAAPGTLKVYLKNGAPGILVSAETTLGTLLPATGTALTDSGGVATFQLEAGPEHGAGTVTATATVNGTDVSAAFNFQVGDTGLRLGYYADDGSFLENQIQIEPQGMLAAGGNAQFSVVVLNSDGSRVTTAEEVRFNSGCIGAGLATIVPEIPKTVNGQASTLYTATGCTGLDKITASLVGAGAQAFGELTVASRETNALNFVSATPELIVLRGTGGQNRDETSDVIFKVVDSSGSALPGVLVQFALSTYVGGLALSKTSSLSDGNGEVAVTVQAGDVATVVRVQATVDAGNGQQVSSVSDLITVTTGLPDQNSISLAIGECGGESSWVVDGAMTIDGLCRTLTVSMADKFNNPVVDGTAAVFTTEYGAIVGSCTTTDGSCSVEWRSQEPRFPTLTGDDYVVSVGDNQGTHCPDHNGINAIPCPTDLGNIRGGRSAIMVHAIGEESFVDSNANGVYDQGEQFQNMPEAFLDNNEDKQYTPALSQCEASPMGSTQCISGQEEIFVDFNSNNIYDLNNDPAVYNGLLCPVDGNGVWCSRTLIDVSASAVVTLGDAPNFYFLLVQGKTILTDLPLDEPFDLFIADTFNNPPPAGATITLKAEGFCKLVSPSTTEALNQPRSGAFRWQNVKLTAQTSTDPGYLTVTLETPTTTLSEKYACETPPVDPCAGNPSPKPPECP
jgi:hypothetical protein